MGKLTAGSRDLATPIGFLVTCVQPEMLDISLHYEWMHLLPAYLTPLLIRLQITGKLLIPIDLHDLVWSLLVHWEHFLGSRYVSRFVFMTRVYDVSCCGCDGCKWICKAGVLQILLCCHACSAVPNFFSGSSQVTREFRHFGFYCPQPESQCSLRKCLPL